MNEQAEAATKIQAIARGRQNRRGVVDNLSSDQVMGIMKRNRELMKRNQYLMRRNVNLEGMVAELQGVADRARRKARNMVREVRKQELQESKSDEEKQALQQQLRIAMKALKRSERRMADLQKMLRTFKSELGKAQKISSTNQKDRSPDGKVSPVGQSSPRARGGGRQVRGGGREARGRVGRRHPAPPTPPKFENRRRRNNKKREFPSDDSRRGKAKQVHAGPRVHAVPGGIPARANAHGRYGPARGDARVRISPVESHASPMGGGLAARSHNARRAHHGLGGIDYGGGGGGDFGGGHGSPSKGYGNKGGGRRPETDNIDGFSLLPSGNMALPSFGGFMGGDDLLLPRVS